MGTDPDRRAWNSTLRQGAGFRPRATPLQSGTKGLASTGGPKRKRSMQAAASQRRTRAELAPVPQAVVDAAVAAIRACDTRVVDAAREIGCDPDWLGAETWKRTKLDVFARDGGRCLLCGTTYHLDAHHRCPRGRGGTRDPDIAYGLANLLTLCRPEHDDAEHHHRAEALVDGLIVKRGTDPATVPVRIRGVRWWFHVDGTTSLYVPTEGAA